MLKIGWSSKDISTTKPVCIQGQFHRRISKGILDPLTLCALALENNGDTAIFVSCDALSLEEGLINEIQDKVRALDPQLPADKILMNATHTHDSPSHQHSGEEVYPPHDGIEIAPSGEYREFLSSKAAEAVAEAYQRRCAGGIAYGYGYAVVSHSRRSVYFDDLSKREGSDPTRAVVDGHARMYGKTKDDMFSGYEAGADHFINLLYTFDENERLTGAIINVPCPSQNSEQEYYLSADYWHDVRTLLKEKYGDIHIITQCAAAGDLSPRILHYRDAQDRRYRLKYAETPVDSRVKAKTEMYNRFDIAQRICESFDEVLAWAKTDICYDPVIKHSVKIIPLGKRMITQEEYEFCRKQLEALNKKEFVKTDDIESDFYINTRLVTSRNRFDKIVKRYEQQKEQKTLPMELHVIRIGDVAFASNKFELFMDFQHRIQARSPFIQTFVVQLCAQPQGTGLRGTYLPTKRGADNKGYSASMFDNLVSPEAGQQIVEETLAELNGLYSESC